MLGYTADLSSRTQGRATCSMYFDHYEQVRRGPDDNVDRWLAGVRLEPGFLNRTVRSLKSDPPLSQSCCRCHTTSPASPARNARSG